MNDFILLKANITREEREAAKRLAKSKGMSFGGFLAHLIREAISNPLDRNEDNTKQMSRF